MVESTVTGMTRFGSELKGLAGAKMHNARHAPDGIVEGAGFRHVGHLDELEGSLGKLAVEEIDQSRALIDAPDGATHHVAVLSTCSATCEPTRPFTSVTSTQAPGGIARSFRGAIASGCCCGLHKVG